MFVAPKDHGDSSILHLQDWLENNYARSVTLEDMAREGGDEFRKLISGSTLRPRIRRYSIRRSGSNSQNGFLSPIARASSESPARLASKISAFIRAFVATVGISPGADLPALPLARNRRLVVAEANVVQAWQAAAGSMAKSAKWLAFRHPAGTAIKLAGSAMAVQKRSRYGDCAASGEYREKHYLSGRGSENKLEWQEKPDLAVQGDLEAIVRPIASATCDLDLDSLAALSPCLDIPGLPLVTNVSLKSWRLETRSAGTSEGTSSWSPASFHAGPASMPCRHAHPLHHGITRGVDRVYGLPTERNWGGLFSEEVRVPFADGMLVPVPSGVTRSLWRARATI